MESSPSRPPKSSGIPRFSRLPVPRSGLQSAISEKKARPNSQTTSNSFGGTLSNVRPASALGSKKENVIKERDVPKENSLHDDLAEALVEQDVSSHRRELSLSDRTMETLSQIPPSPSPRRRRSSFFQSETPLGTPSRPASSLARQRPSTSHGRYPPLSATMRGSRPVSPEKRQLLPTSGNISPQKTPAKSGSTMEPPSITRPYSRLNSTFSSSLRSKPLQQENSQSPMAKMKLESPSRLPDPDRSRNSRTYAGRSIKPRPSAQKAFEELGGKSPLQEVAASNTTRIRSDGTLKSHIKPPKPANTKISQHSDIKLEENNASTTKPSPKSSAALRATIAKAKAEHLKTHKNQTGKANTGIQDFGDVWDDQDLVSNNKGLLKKRIQMARTDGRLNIAAMNLAEIPPEVKKMYTPEVCGGNWYDSVDLVRLIAADNVITKLDEMLFPDDQSRSDEDEYQGSIFGGLENIDLHGNHIGELPTGLRRLPNLCILNLSKNRLNSDAISTLSQVQSLKELRLSDNNFEGTLDDRIFNLSNLVVLDLQNCKVDGISTNVVRLQNLRKLLVAGNRIEHLPLEAMSSMGLTDLDVSHNRLRGTLISMASEQLPNLRYLDASYNSLVSVASEILEMPRLEFLHVAENRIGQLPDFSRCTGLITLTASGNQISTIPEGLSDLKNLKNLDLARNDLKKVDERLGFLDGLTNLTLANNPLRDRKFLTLNTEDLKRELRARIEPAGDSTHVDGATETRNGNPGSKPGWKFETGGVIERIPANVDGITAIEIEEIARIETVKGLILRHNSFSHIPDCLGVISTSLTSLDLSHNTLSGSSYLPEQMQLPKLKTLNLSHNAISTLQPLLQNLQASRLVELDLSRNQLTDLPVLRIVYPALVSVIAADNKIEALEVESVRGLEALNVTGNEISHLEPKLGLLQGEGLRVFLVGANRFRVPKRDVVEKGTAAILTWLKGRIPEEEM